MKIQTWDKLEKFKIKEIQIHYLIIKIHVVFKIQAKLPFTNIFYDLIGLAFEQRRTFYSRM
jgi:hypothetical protein